MNTNEEMLQFLYKSASMSVDTTARVIAKTHDARLRRELNEQKDGYRRFADDAVKGLKSHGLTPQDNPLMTKLMTNVGISVNTMIDSTPSHIAEIMINGTNMGVLKMNKHLNRNKDISEETNKLCRELIDFQKNSATKLEAYLA
ncbi:MAG: hypothetical protein E7635_00550 [Ruminococcaceae bacterium]|nr:hypothetical protein [Oscillospiraceae bacterium]